ncbi:uncharacterized protein E0L32_011244 [Thyridium curvatum]|uniref:FAD-binding domain-containing protein n=1 Tax=Thyridium curvatum TaxID=1093900 RepID=A0A507BHT2_9PEZI|nr:uncharacterized protein E0L32_011244 [Thyridium curvatum]TPX19083.1 hypothetical protein E0L32_011244 [Thyridium curvatum]
MPEAHDVPVLIVGGGIVGLCASLFLSHQGVKSLVVERHAGTSIHPRARGVNRRTMELFREIGVADAVRDAGADLSPSMGIYHGRSLAEVIEPLKRSAAAAPAGGRRMPGAAYFEWLGPAEGARGTQDKVEPVLLAAARERGGEMRFHTECVGFDQDENGITATLRDRTTEAESPVRAAYMIAADGAGSPVRRELGVPTTGAGRLGYLLNILFEADLAELVRGREFSLCLVDRPEVKGLFTSINNSDVWVFHLSYIPGPGSHAEDFTPERCRDLIRIALGMPDVDIHVKSILPWEPTVRVAESFQHGRIFLAGDAAHQMPPYGGQGATSGIADVHNLAWKLAAVLNKEANRSLLATYDAERVPIGRLVSEESGAMADEHGLISTWKSLPAIWALVKRMPRLAGYGYSYTSQAINTEDATPLWWRAIGLLPSLSYIIGIDGQAGTRAPHLWVSLKDRRISTLDLFGKGFVVVAGSEGNMWQEVAPRVAATLGVQLASYRAGPSGDLVAPSGRWESLAGITKNGALLMRPDGFVAWRSWTTPPNAERKLEEVLKGVLCR